MRTSASPRSRRSSLNLFVRGRYDQQPQIQRHLPGALHLMGTGALPLRRNLTHERSLERVTHSPFCFRKFYGGPVASSMELVLGVRTGCRLLRCSRSGCLFAATPDDRELMAGDSCVILIFEDEDLLVHMVTDLVHEVYFQVLVATAPDETLVQQYLPRCYPCSTSGCLAMLDPLFSNA